jgi:hypothetical protein
MDSLRILGGGQTRIWSDLGAEVGCDSVVGHIVGYVVNNELAVYLCMFGDNRSCIPSHTFHPHN